MLQLFLIQACHVIWDLRHALSACDDDASCFQRYLCMAQASDDFGIFVIGFLNPLYPLQQYLPCCRTWKLATPMLNCLVSLSRIDLLPGTGWLGNNLMCLHFGALHMPPHSLGESWPLAPTLWFLLQFMRILVLVPIIQSSLVSAVHDYT